MTSAHKAQPVCTLLILAACLGGSFDFQTLDVLHEKSRRQTADAMQEALEQGIIIPLTANYRIFHFLESINDNSMSGSDVRYRFQHDRLRQASYERIPDEDKQTFHLRTSRLLVKHTYFEKAPERLLDIVHHLNYALPLISEIVLERLLDRLIQISLENAGADRHVSGSQRIDFSGRDRICRLTERVDHQDLDAGGDFPASVIRYVACTREHPVIDDATTDARFFKDPFIVKKQPKSLLCTGVAHPGDPVAILYLENSHVRDAFTNDRIALLQLLSGQMAASIHNAELYASLDKKVQERGASNRARQT